VRIVSNLVQLVFLIILSLCVGHPWSATCQSGGPGASDDPSKQSTAKQSTAKQSTAKQSTAKQSTAKQSTAIPIGTQTKVLEAPDNKSNKGTFILAEVEPLLLLLFGLLLFSVATVIKLKLSRINKSSGRRFEPLVSRPASGSEARR